MHRPFTALFIAVCSSLFATQGVAQTPSDISVPQKENFHLFLLAGQSNMAGRGIIDDQALVAHPRVLVLSKEGTWIPATAPLHFDKTVAGVGLGKTFALELAKADPSVTIGLIPAACGGSSVSVWVPGAYFKATKSHPYDDAIERTKHAMTSGTLKGILWHQGESDGKAGQAEPYEKRLAALIHRFRDELATPHLPFIIGQLGRFPGKPWNAYREQVNAAHIQICNTLPHTRFVSAEQLTSKSDLTHFDTASLRIFGQRYAAAYLSLLAEKDTP